MEEKELIQKCIDMIVEKVNWGSVDSWTHSHFENLSEEIYKESNIRINSRTIKRIFTKEGKDKSYHPQIETKNAFAMFLGYENWFDFISKRGKKKPYYIFGAFLHSKKTLFTLLGIIIVSVIIYLMSSIQTPCDYEYTFKPVKQ